MKALSLTLIAAVGLIMAPMYSPAQTTSTQTQGGQVNPSLSLGQLPVQPIYQWQKTEPNIVIKNRGNNFLTAGSLWDSKPSTPETEVSTTSGDTTVTQHFEATQPTETTKTLTPEETAARGAAYQPSTANLHAGYNHDGLAFLDLNSKLDKAASAHADEIQRGYQRP